MTLDPSSLDDSFLTVAEVAEMLKLNQQTVRNWIDQGSLPALRVGRRVRIRRSDFERMLEDGYSGGAPPARAGTRAERRGLLGRRAGRPLAETGPGPRRRSPMS